MNTTRIIRRPKREREVRRLDVAVGDVSAPIQRGWDPLALRAEVEGAFREFGARVWREEVRT